jgi:hypothetical protein
MPPLTPVALRLCFQIEIGTARLARSSGMLARNAAYTDVEDTGVGMREHIRFHKFPLIGIDAMSAATARAFPRHTHDQCGIGVMESGGMPP